MAMVKICPRSSCRMINPPNALECEKCGRDMTKIPMIDESQLAAMNEEEETQTSNDTAVSIEPEQTRNERVSEPEVQLQSYRLCDCGHRNPTSLRKCERCGESLAGIDITEEQIAAEQPAKTVSSPTRVNENLNPSISMVSQDGGLRLPLTQGTMIIGRNNMGSPYLSQKMYVSGTHASITVEGDEISIIDLNSTNGTFLNGIKIVPGNKTIVNPGDVVGLGGNQVTQTSAAFLTFTKGNL